RPRPDAGAGGPPRRAPARALPRRRAPLPHQALRARRPAEQQALRDPRPRARGLSAGAPGERDPRDLWRPRAPRRGATGGPEARAPGLRSAQGTRAPGLARAAGAAPRAPRWLPRRAPSDGARHGDLGLSRARHDPPFGRRPAPSRRPTRAYGSRLPRPSRTRPDAGGAGTFTGMPAPVAGDVTTRGS